MPLALGVSPPSPLSCRRSQFPSSPWRWPNQPPRRSPLPTPKASSFTHPPQSRALQEAGRSPSDRPFLLLAKKKATASRAAAFVRPILRRSVRLGAELLVAGAAGFAGVTERGRECRHV